MSYNYGRAEWRRDLGRLVKGLMSSSSSSPWRDRRAASRREDDGQGKKKKGEEEEKKEEEAGEDAEEEAKSEQDEFDRGDTALYVTASQLLRKRDFLLPDIRSLLIRGEVEGLFSIEERHELNEVGGA